MQKDNRIQNPFFDFEENSLSFSGSVAVAQGMGDEGMCIIACNPAIITIPCDMMERVNCGVVITPGPGPSYPPSPSPSPPSYNPCDPANPAYNPCNCNRCGPSPGSGGSSGSGSGDTCKNSGCGCGKPAPTTYYLDADGDGMGGTQTRKACSKPSGYVTNSGDCNDKDPGRKTNCSKSEQFPCGSISISCGEDAHLDESTCTCVLGPKPCENPNEIRDSNGECVVRTKDDPCSTQAKLKSTFNRPDVSEAYNGLKAQQSQSAEWGHTLYADISNGLTYTASANTTSGLDRAWEDFTLETQMTAFTIGQEHTHPAGTDDNPSPVDIVSLARMVLFMQENDRGLNAGEKYIVRSFNMGVSIGTYETWSYHIPNNAAAQQIVNTFNNTYGGSYKQMETDYGKLFADGYQDGAILYKMFGVNNVDLMKAKNSSPGSPQYQVLSKNGKSTGKADCQ